MVSEATKLIFPVNLRHNKPSEELIKAYSEATVAILHYVGDHSKSVMKGFYDLKHLWIAGLEEDDIPDVLRAAIILHDRKNDFYRYSTNILVREYFDRLEEIMNQSNTKFLVYDTRGNIMKCNFMNIPEYVAPHYLD